MLASVIIEIDVTNPVGREGHGTSLFRHRTQEGKRIRPQNAAFNCRILRSNTR
jgi:hypothetical protein